MIAKRFYRARLQSIIGATQKRHGLILRTSCDFIVRQLLRSSDPLKAKARHPASEALAFLAPSVASRQAAIRYSARGFWRRKSWSNTRVHHDRPTIGTASSGPTRSCSMQIYQASCNRGAVIHGGGDASGIKGPPCRVRVDLSPIARASRHFGTGDLLFLGPSPKCPLGGVKALGYNIFCALASAATRRPRVSRLGRGSRARSKKSGNQVAVE